ncbi:MAG: hypothetical protein L6R39_000754 [Caloplaca ligustica]|nr:MAG: hypothetical protein L6R39_000754 [Caloplaca ligustica]
MPPIDDSQASASIASSSFFDADSRKRRKESISPSESGTEADDESGPFLKGLPAPPTRLRKGLKQEASLGTPSPLLTPSYLDDEKRRQGLEAQFRRRTSLQSYASTDEETLKIREKFQKRRRAELLRRTTETLLFMGIGCLACWNVLLLPVKRELAVFALVVCGTYLLYPFRLYYHHRTLPKNGSQSRQFLRIPAAFDPATLLYPVLLPLFVSSSLQSGSHPSVIVNIALGVTAMPRTIVPSQDTLSGHTSVQYLLSVLPVVFRGRVAANPDTPQLHLAADPEILSILYPLHQALLPSLGYLTTTSLLPAELQLLSISMINVLIFSASPQSVILKALIWIGGLSIFVLCRRVLEWEVALARIPSWRFRRDNDYNRLYLVLKRMLKEFAVGRRGRPSRAGKDSDEADSDEPQRFMRNNPQRGPRGRTMAISNDDSTLLRSRTAMTASSIAGSSAQWPMKAYGASSQDPSEIGRHRSSTLPSFTGSIPDRSSSRDNKEIHSTMLRLSMPKTFRSLTRDQATITKWLCALYTYITVSLIIAVPVRMFVSKYALYGQEPVGWALGYVFSDIDYFRSIVKAVGLEPWVQLAPNDVGRVVFYGWAESVRWQSLGAANTRLLICLHCVFTIGLGLAIVFRLSEYADVDTRRKVFHGMMVAMFLPTVFVDPAFIALALTLVLAFFLLMDLFRASQLPPLSNPLTNFLAPYVDGRDHRGPATIAATGASVTEAVLTGGNDNVIVPVILWLLVRGLAI